VSGQRHAPGRALPPGRGPLVPIVQEAGWAPEPVWTQRLEEKSFAPAGDLQTWKNYYERLLATQEKTEDIETNLPTTSEGNENMRNLNWKDYLDDVSRLLLLLVVISLPV
jgi:hypothetical protein